MKTKYINIFSLAAVVSFTLLACGGGEEHGGPVDEEVTTDTLSAEVKMQINVIRVSIPSPLLVTKQISKGGYNYNKSVLNPSSKASGYSGKLQAAANLGVYGADLGYAAGYSQSQDVLEYVAQIGRLAKTVGVESAFDQEFGKELNDNIGKEDTLGSIIDNAYAKAERNMRSNARVNAASIMIAGGWVEGLYIATQALSGTSTSGKDSLNTELYHTIYNHVSSYTYVTDLLTALKGDADCAKMLEDIKSIEKTITPYTIMNKMKKEDVMKIKEIIAPLRAKITG